MAALRPSAHRITTSLLRTRLAASASTPAHHPARPAAQQPQLSFLFYSSSTTSAPATPATAEPAPPPLLQKLKGELKGAMRARDAPRLTALRAVLAAAVNASKTAAPVTTDAHVVALLRRARRATQEAREEAEAAGRGDLAGRNRLQVAALDEYLAGSGFAAPPGGDELRALVAAAVAEAGPGAGGKARVGDVMKALLAPEGPLAGKEVEKGELAKVVKEVIG